MLLSQEADLLILTEVHRTLSLDGYTSHFSDPAPPGAGYPAVEAAVAILHRWVDNSFQRIAIDERDNLALCMSFANSPMGPIVVYGSIIPYQHADKLRRAKSWDSNRESAARQTADWRSLMTRPVLGDASLIVAGDFNTTLFGHKTRRGGRYGHTESRAALEQSFDGRLVWLTREDPMDYVGRHTVQHLLIDSRLALQRRFKTVYWNDVRTSPRLSDHNGITATLESL